MKKILFTISALIIFSGMAGIADATSFSFQTKSQGVFDLWGTSQTDHAFPDISRHLPKENDAEILLNLINDSDRGGMWDLFNHHYRSDLFPGFHFPGKDRQEGKRPVASPVPEPATMLLFGSGMIGIVGLRKKFLS